MSIEDNKQLARQHSEGWNQGNFALIEEILAPDFIHHDPDRPDVRSREDYKRWFAESRSLFPDLHITNDIQVAEVDQLSHRDIHNRCANRGPALLWPDGHLLRRLPVVESWGGIVLRSRWGSELSASVRDGCFGKRESI